MKESKVKKEYVELNYLLAVKKLITKTIIEEENPPLEHGRKTRSRYSDPAEKLLIEIMELSSQGVDESGESLKTLTKVVKAYTKNGYTIYDFIELLTILEDNHSKVLAQGRKLREAFGKTLLALKEYYEVFSTETIKKNKGKSVVSEFSKLPVDWQWEASVVSSE